jgi:precorrin-2 dehydrogenase / sirohydrochlorin ferrochelatase
MSSAIDEPLYPLNLRLAGQPCLVVGGGPVAARKARGLLDAGARVTVVAPEITDELAEVDGIDLQRRPYGEGDVAGYRLVITATGRAEVDDQVYRDAESRGVLVNAADDPEHCRFILPAVARRGPLLATFSTSGRSPALATWLRRRYETELGPEYLLLLDLLAEQRQALQRRGTPTEGLDWQPALDSGMLELIREGHLAEAKERLEACLSSSSG